MPRTLLPELLPPGSCIRAPEARLLHRTGRGRKKRTHRHSVMRALFARAFVAQDLPCFNEALEHFKVLLIIFIKVRSLSMVVLHRKDNHPGAILCT